MKRIYYILISTLLLTFVSDTILLAQSQLAVLPLGIRMGITKNAEIESKGICVAKIRMPDSSFRCTRFSMSGDKFYLYSGPDQSVVKISFLAVSHHVLPQNWLDLGIRLASTYRYRRATPNQENNANILENEGGNTQEEFIAIIKANGAKDIKRRISYSSDYQIGETISFTIGNLLYDAEFIKWIKPNWCQNCPDYPDYNNGLVAIEITETYD